MKSKISILILLLSYALTAQIKYDTVITTLAYKSYFSYEYKAPVMVSYKLFKGGGDCSRTTNTLGL
jgi:hypothetical protein